jgi:hypothetical protein
MKVEVRIAYTIQKVPEGIKAAFKGSKDWEVLEPDGYRYSFANTEQDAMDELVSMVNEMIGSMNFEVIKFDEEDDDDS